MTSWQEQFTRKVDAVRQASVTLFQQIADDALVPVYIEIKEFVTQQGIDATAPMKKLGLRTYKFEFSENAYLLLTFRVAGLEHCESVAEFSVPHVDKPKPLVERTALGAFDGSIAQGTFERALDAFMELYLKSLDSKQAAAPEPAGAKRA
jgi:hypothetical protein